MRRNILFVDHEPQVHESLRRTLPTLPREWEVEFARTGQDALRALALRPFDVVVSDIQMPDMKGAELLASVKERHPQVVRITLSGYSDRDETLLSLGAAHQYLSKPCEARALESAVTRAFALRDMLTDDSIAAIVSRVESLPCMRSLFTELMREIDSPHCSIDRVAEIISKDVGMAAKILQLANSVFFGLGRKVSNLARAVTFLGLETVKAMAVTLKIFSQYSASAVPGFSMASLFEHSVTTGILARAIAKEEKAESSTAEDAFAAGLLHDVGTLVLVGNLPDCYREIMEVSNRQGIAIWEAEKMILGTSHAQVGAYLMGLWGLASPVVEAIAFHHCPKESRSKGFSPLTAVHAANCIERGMRPVDQGRKTARIDTGYLEGLQLADRPPVWEETCRRTIYQS